MCDDYSTKCRNRGQDLVSDVRECFVIMCKGRDAAPLCGDRENIPCGWAWKAPISTTCCKSHKYYLFCGAGGSENTHYPAAIILNNADQPKN